MYISSALHAPKKVTLKHMTRVVIVKGNIQFHIGTPSVPLKIVIDLYRKPNDRNEYILPDSCYANIVKENILYSLFLRITRICSNIHTKERCFDVQGKTLTHWRTMTMVDPQLQEIYPEPPLIAYQRQKTVKDFMIRARIQNSRNEICTYKGQQCHACPYVRETKEIQSKKYTCKKNLSVNCGYCHIVYLIECSTDICPMKHVGETDITMRESF